MTNVATQLRAMLKVRRPARSSVASGTAVTSLQVDRQVIVALG